MTATVPSDPNWARFLRGTSLALLAALYLTVLHGFYWKSGADLSRDEALNQHAYASHPFTAFALYHEPNNHVLESLWKSLFYWGLGFDGYPWRRLPGLLIGFAFIGLIFRGVVRRWRAGEQASASILALLLGASTVFNEHALELRGYFPSMMLAFAFIELQVAGVSAYWLRLRRILLGAAMILLLPTNVVLVAVLLFWAALRDHEREGTATLRNFGKLFGLTLLASLLLYSPILLGLAIGLSSFQGFETLALPFAASLRGVLETCTLMGPNPFAWWGILLVVIALGVWKRGRAEVRHGLVLMLSSLGAALFLQFGCHVPLVTIAVFGIPVLLGLEMVLRGLTAAWPEFHRQIASFNVVVVLVLMAIPAILEHTERENKARPISALMVTIRGLDLGDRDRILVLHEADSRLRLELEREFGDLQVAGSGEELRTHAGKIEESEAQLLSSVMREAALGKAPGGLRLERMSSLLLIEDHDHRGNHWLGPAGGWESYLPGFREIQIVSVPEFRLRLFRR